LYDIGAAVDEAAVLWMLLLFWKQMVLVEGAAVSEGSCDNFFLLMFLELLFLLFMLLLLLGHLSSSLFHFCNNIKILNEHSMSTILTLAQ